MPRPVGPPVQDPLDVVWVQAARQCGFQVVRSGEVYAHADGRGILVLSDAAGFDADDSLAQLVLHELCHGMVEGPDRLGQADWGLDNQSDRDRPREHAALRLQAALADRHGLRRALAPTTAFRGYYDALPPDPLALGLAADPAILPARQGWDRARRGPWAAVVHRALRATAQVAATLAPWADPGSYWASVDPMHPLGHAALRPDQRCAGCAWTRPAPRGRWRCRRADARPGAPRTVTDTTPACVLWEPRFDERTCAACGACCHGGFDLVPLGRRHRLLSVRPDLVAHDAHGPHLPRPGGRCTALDGHGTPEAAYRCSVYSLRPTSCRHFAVAGPHCLSARVRAGVSPPP